MKLEYSRRIFFLIFEYQI